MKRGIFSALVCATLVSAVALALVAAAFKQPHLAQRVFLSSKRTAWTVATHSNAEIVAQANQAVVTVIATRAMRQQASYNGNLVPQQYEIAPTQSPDQNVQRGTGTGFVIDAEGFIVTNDHVIRGADRIRVRLNDGRERRAVVHGSDPATDIALIKIEADQLTVLNLGDSDEVRVGDPVMAIGNPLDYEHSVTAGIISAKGRKVYNNEPFEDFIQTDAAINRGNSGGPLLNQQGEVVGVNTVIRVDGSGISFAVPSNVVKRVIAQLRAKRTVTRGYLGLTPISLTTEFREGLGLGNQQLGVLVADLAPEKPAARAGLQIYDVITHFDGKPITSTDEYFSLVANTLPQRQVALTVLRGGQSLKLTAVLEERDKDDGEKQTERPITLAQNESPIGFSVRERFSEISHTSLTVETSAEAQSKVEVSEIDPLGPASESGLTTGQIILEANRQPVHTLADFNRIVGSLRKGSVLMMRVNAPPQSANRLVAVRIGGE